jgi:hypothetical protein
MTVFEYSGNYQWEGKPRKASYYVYKNHRVKSHTLGCGEKRDYCNSFSVKIPDDMVDKIVIPQNRKVS